LTVDELIASLDHKLAGLQADYQALDLRQKVLRLVAIFKEAKRLNVHVIRDSGCDAGDARERIRLYLVQHIGIVLDACELEVVSGISEYGRRVRELRVQDGYRILSCFSSDAEMGIELKRGQYLLLRPEPDATAARRWHIANRIRQQRSMGARDRILAYLKENVGQVVLSEEIQYVANIKDYPRRIRELRTEEGYAVATCFTGRPDLGPGEYVLEVEERVAAPHDRFIPYDVQRSVYQRDANRCRLCRWAHEMWSPEDVRYLELHHLEHHVEGGANLAENLLVLCNRCHDDVHARRAVLPMVNPYDGRPLQS